MEGGGGVTAGGRLGGEAVMTEGGDTRGVMGGMLPLEEAGGGGVRVWWAVGGEGAERPSLGGAAGGGGVHWEMEEGGGRSLRMGWCRLGRKRSCPCCRTIRRHRQQQPRYSTVSPH